MSFQTEIHAKLCSMMNQVVHHEAPEDRSLGEGHHRLAILKQRPRFHQIFIARAWREYSLFPGRILVATRRVSPFHTPLPVQTSTRRR